MMPTEHLEPGVVVAHSAAATGILDLGGFPDGVDEVDEGLAAALRASHCESVARPDIMRWKYRKLLNNLGNAVQALCGTGLDSEEAETVLDLLAAEAERAFAAAGIDPVTEAEDHERRGDHLRLEPVAGATRGGGSTWQSLARGDRCRDRLPQRRDRPARPAARRADAGERPDPDAHGRGRGACGRPGEMTPAELLAELRG